MQLSHFSGILEEWIKTSLANVINNNYIPNEYQQAEFYLDLNIYDKEELGKKTLASFAETVTRNKESYIKDHHKEKWLYSCLGFDCDVNFLGKSIRLYLS